MMPPKKPTPKKPRAVSPAKKPSRKPPALRASPPTDPGEAHREREAARRLDQSASIRDINNPVPGFPRGYRDLAIADPDRRERCKKSLRLFCETYNPAALYWGWSDNHLRAIARIEEAATLGALYALAMPRGSGKTTLCRMAALWALSNAICRYVFVIGANDDKATTTLDALRVFIRFLPVFAADYPEVSYPAQRLGGIAQRGQGQLCGGVSTLIEWGSDKIQLATVPPPKNWPSRWPLRADGMVPTSGAIVSASGLTGEGIRGSLKTLTTGAQIRPDFVLLDDPQTHESANSLPQNEARERLVSQDVLGMAGPGAKLAAVMPCTVIAKGDLIDRVLDRSKYPMWRGERSGILKSLPKNLVAWDRYFEVYTADALKEPPDFTASNAHYALHQAALDEGAEATWVTRKFDTEVSAVQHAMHLRFRDPIGFAAEYMNEPVVIDGASAAALTSEEVEAKATNLPRGVVPRTCTRLTALFDVGAHLLWSVVVAWDETFGGCVIDYQVYPEQARSYFPAAEPRPGLADVPELAGQSQAAAIYAGLAALTRRVLAVGYRQEETNAELRVEKALVDANWGPGTDLVYEFCRRSEFASILLPSHGRFIGASGNPMTSWSKKPEERVGTGWFLTPHGRGRHLVVDVNHWKTFVAARLRTPPGSAGCLSLFAPPPGGHRLFADHCTAEYPVAVARQAGGRVVEEWKTRLSRDNHWWDCLVGSAAAASLAGVTWHPSGTPEPKRERKKRDIEEMYKKARANG